MENVQDKDGGRERIVRNVPITSIRHYADNPRMFFNQNELDKLANSLRVGKIKDGHAGQLDPLLVRELKPSELDPQKSHIKYEIISGERRWLAAPMAGLTHVDIIIREVETPREQFELALICNIEQEPLNPIEEAYAIKKFLNWGLSQRKIGEKFGWSQTRVQKRHSLLKLPDEILKRIGPETSEESRLAPEQALLLVGLPKAEQIQLARKMSKGAGMTTTSARRLVVRTVQKKKIIPTNRNVSRFRLMEDYLALSRFLKRTREYLDRILSLDEKEFQNFFGPEKLNEVKNLAGLINSNSMDFESLSQALEKIIKEMKLGGTKK